MSELDALRTFYRFNATVRRQYLDAILRLPPAERLRDRGASYPSLQEIYAHVLDSHRYWFELVPQDRAQEALSLELPARELTEPQLRAATDAVDLLVNNFLRPLQESDLGHEITFRPWAPEGAPRHEKQVLVADLLWHMVEEELQHRGELNALLWQMDVDPPLGTLALWHKSKTGQTSPH